MVSLIPGSRRVSASARHSLYGPEDPADTLYMVHQGQVRVYQIGPQRSRRLVEILGSGGWCGVAAMAGLARYGEAAEVVSPSVISAVPVEGLLAYLRQQPAASVELMRHLAGKLINLREEAGGLVFEDCHHRLVRTLLRLSSSAAASPSPEGVIVRITHQQLAQAVGVARETVSLALSGLRRRCLLRTGRNQLVFDPEKLRSSELEPAGVGPATP